MNSHNFYIYSNFDFSRKSAGATRMLYYAKALAGESHQVFLVSCCSNSISDKDFNEIASNVFVHNNKKLSNKPGHTIRFLRNLVAFSNKKKGNKTFVFYPSPLIYLEIFALLYLKVYKGFSVFYELNEIRKYSSSFHSPLSIKKIKYSLKKITYKTVFTLMEPLLFFYDGLLCISTSIMEYGNKLNKNSIRIPILTDPNIQIEESKTIYSNKSAFNIGFSGSIKPSKENLEDFIKVLHKISQDGYTIAFNLCGMVSDNDYEYLFNNVIKSLQLTNTIHYYGNLNEKELSTFLGQQDLLVIPRGFSLQNKYGFSTKLSDYLNHKKIILLTDISDNKLYIEDGKNGFIVPPNRNDLMYKKIKYIIENFDSLEKKITQNALATSKKEFHYILYRKSLRSFLIGN